MLLGLFLYLLVGIVALLVSSVLFVIEAIKRGYYEENLTKAGETVRNKPYFKVRFIIGWLIWPIKLTDFLINREDYYEMIFGYRR